MVLRPGAAAIALCSLARISDTATAAPTRVGEAALDGKRARALAVELDLQHVILVPGGLDLPQAAFELGVPVAPLLDLATTGRVVVKGKHREYSLIVGGETDGTPASIFPPSVPEQSWSDPAWQSRLPTPEELDAVVRLVYAGAKQRVCTAVAISDRWLLTAAHCVTPRPTSLLLGPDIATATLVPLSTKPDDCRVPAWFGDGSTDVSTGIRCGRVKQDLLRSPVVGEDSASRPNA